MKYGIRKTSRYRKSLKKMLRRGKDIRKISAVVGMLAMGETLPPQYRDHALSGDLEGLRDCHIENDWVLLYFYTATGELVLTLTDTGTHADLFYPPAFWQRPARHAAKSHASLISGASSAGASARRV